MMRLVLTAAIVLLLTPARPSAVAQQIAAPKLSAAPAKNAASPTLERILKNWRLRQDRTKSLHMTWDTKLPRLTNDEDKPAKDDGFRVLHNEVWMDGDSRSRLELSFTRGRGCQLTQFGKTHASCIWQFGSTKPVLSAVWSADGPRNSGYEQIILLEVDPRLQMLSTRVPWVYFRSFDADAIDPMPFIRAGGELRSTQRPGPSGIPASRLVGPAS